MKKDTLFDLLTAYGDSDFYPFHMPGHKRNPEMIMGAGRIDITEIDGFDNLHHAEGVLLDARKRASGLYGSFCTFYLVNGSTCGILAAVYACTSQRGKILMARNCHKAVYHAVQLRELEASYLYPPKEVGRAQINGRIDPADVEKALSRDDKIEAVFITSPTYDGVVCDVKSIARITAKYGVYLIVDEAHGAHFGFHPYFPESSVGSGADIVIHSLHKTLPSLTQTALLHVCRRKDGEECAPEASGAEGCAGREDAETLSERVQSYLGIFETSSPSYVFMAGMDRCIELVRERGKELFDAFAARLEHVRGEIGRLKTVHLLTVEGVTDPSRLLICADGYNGAELAAVLREEYHLEMEMTAPAYVVALTSIADTDEGFERLVRALTDIDRRSLAGNEGRKGTEDMRREEAPQEGESMRREEAPGNGERIRSEETSGSWDRRLKVRYTIAEALAGKPVPEMLANCAGRICGEYIYLYPPGIPSAVPGDELTEDVIREIQEYQRIGLSVQGMADHSGKELRVMENN